MALKKIVVSGNRVALGGTNKTTGKANPTTIQGYFLGTSVENGANGEYNVHTLKTDKGEIGVFGKTNLDRALKQVNVGEFVLIEYKGLTQEKAEKRSSHKFDVSVDAEDIYTTEETVETSSHDADVSEAYEEAEESDIDADEEAQDTAPPARAVAPKKAAPVADAARQAKVKALLSKGKSATN